MEMTAEQLAMITGQFKTLKDRSAFYAKKFEGIDLADVKTQADFEKLPFSEKDDLRAAYPLGLQAVPDEEVVRIHSSSGTTGTPVIIPYTQQDVIDWATQFARCYEMAGITPMDRIQITPGDVYKRQGLGFVSPPRWIDSRFANRRRNCASVSKVRASLLISQNTIICLSLQGRQRPCRSLQQSLPPNTPQVLQRHRANPQPRFLPTYRVPFCLNS